MIDELRKCIGMICAKIWGTLQEPAINFTPLEQLSAGVVIKLFMDYCHLV